MAFNRAPTHQPSFAAWVNERHHDYFPAIVDGGMGGYTSNEAAAHIGDLAHTQPGPALLGHRLRHE